MPRPPSNDVAAQPLRPLRKTIATAAVAATLLGAVGQADADVRWPSGVACSGGDFGTWRGTPIDVVSSWAPWKGGTWTEMYNWASGSSPRSLNSKAPEVSVGLGLFPRGMSLAACAAGDYKDEHRTIGSRLAANGGGDFFVRLGWEASNGSYPWTAVGKPAEQWKACFTNAAQALKSGAPDLRIVWHMAKKGKINVNTIWPGSVVDAVGVSHYDDGQARFGTETSGGSPWGLMAWADFAAGKGVKLVMAEWGMRDNPDNTTYFQRMHDFFHAAGAKIGHEAYFNCGNEQKIYPASGGDFPQASARYRELW
jgi:hypothetical protein